MSKDKAPTIKSKYYCQDLSGLVCFEISEFCRSLTGSFLRDSPPHLRPNRARRLASSVNWQASESESFKCNIGSRLQNVTTCPLDHEIEPYSFICCKGCKLLSLASTISSLALSQPLAVKSKHVFSGRTTTTLKRGPKEGGIWCLSHRVDYVQMFHIYILLISL